jgi:cytosine/uracil/thiamine/allantoin permease
MSDPESLARKWNEKFSLTYLWMAVVAAVSAVAFLVTAFLPGTSSRGVLIVIGLALLAASVLLATQITRRSAGRRDGRTR